MEKFKVLHRIKELYARGENIIQYLKSLDNSEKNSLEDILISYDFQAGIYTQRAEINREVREIYCQNLANVLEGLGNFDSLLEVGVGEASTLGNLLLYLKKQPKHLFGFDLSWSRIKYAFRFLETLNIETSHIQLSTGDLFNAPFANNSIDIVYTSHSLEPNGGQEKEALQELYRIARKYVVLLEPAYELAHEEARKRMLKNGYVTKLHATAQELGYEILKYELFEPTFKPINPTGLMIIKKEIGTINKTGFACPATHSPLQLKKGALFAEEALLAYPILDDIPCLLPQNAIIASHFLDG